MAGSPGSGTSLGMISINGPVYWALLEFWERSWTLWLANVPFTSWLSKSMHLKPDESRLDTCLNAYISFHIVQFGSLWVHLVHSVLDFFCCLHSFIIYFCFLFSNHCPSVVLAFVNYRIIGNKIVVEKIGQKAQGSIQNIWTVTFSTVTFNLKFLNFYSVLI